MTAIPGPDLQRRGSCRASSPSRAAGWTTPFLLDPSLTYTVPHDREAQLVYFRAGNASPHLIYVVIMRDGEPMRYFPIGAEDAHARHAARGRGPARPDTRLEARSSPRRRAPARSSSTSGSWRSDAPGRDRQRHGRRARGRGDPRARRRRLRHHGVRRRAVRQLQPDPALQRARGQRRTRARSSSIRSTGTPRTASRCTPACASPRSTASRRPWYAGDGRRRSVRQADHRDRQRAVHPADRRRCATRTAR